MLIGRFTRSLVLDTRLLLVFGRRFHGLPMNHRRHIRVRSSVTRANEEIPTSFHVRQSHGLAMKHRRHFVFVRCFHVLALNPRRHIRVRRFHELSLDFRRPFVFVRR